MLNISEFAHPETFLLLLILPMLILAWKWRSRSSPRLIFPYIRLAYKAVLQESKNRLPLLCYTHEILRCAIIICLIIAAARPQLSQGPQKIKSEGLDMMLVLDTSTSMLAKDLKTSQGQANRLQVAKGVLNEFIQQRKDDRLGITIFGAQAYAYTPLTIDHQVLLQYLEEVEVGMAGEATALGDAIGVATNRLKEVKSHNPIMILLTDGENTAGSLSPLQAAEAAKALRIRIYTVGVGSNGLVPFPTPMGDRPVQIRLDEKTLRMIAKSTGGRYFRATDAASLAKIYDMIDKLEKTEQESEYYIQKEELFAPWVWGALLLLLLELLFQFSIWKPIP